MSKKKILTLFLILCFIGWQTVKAFQQTGIENHYHELGYKSVSQAIQEAEFFYGTNIKLPELPPLEFTHSFGRFSEEHENLEIEFLNEKKRFNYIINIMPSEIRMNTLGYTKISLEDGTQAYYSSSGTDHKVMVFIFEKNNWIYMLSIEEALLDNPLQTLADVANSL
ncbi:MULTISPECIES: hypothetical protein [Bhargavaea]|uniref:DUF4367 domain-containing protein n=1 Tax=Bhargavaea changchunensis TaxID=2134037 RepID=A0ABW2NKF4_9BACL|nr:hypothetical protein [Bhargavaea sp. CC-171006]